MSDELHQILDQFKAEEESNDQPLIDRLIKEENGKQYKRIKHKNLKVCILNSNMISNENKSYRLVSLKTEESKPNTELNKIMVCVYYRPIEKTAPSLLLKAVIDLNEELESDSDGNAFDPFDYLKKMLFSLLKDRDLYCWSAIEDMERLCMMASIPPMKKQWIG